MGDASFHWRLPGLDRDRFEALAKLLRLRNGSQLHEPASSFDMLPDDEDAEDGDLITASRRHGTAQEIKLMRSFLDGLAELVVSVRGRDHVAATLLIRRPDRVEMLVSGDKEMKQGDPAVEILERLQAGLRQIVALGYDDPKSVPVGARLWEDLVYAYRSRITDYTRDVQEAFARIGWTPESPTPRLGDNSLTSARLELSALYLDIDTHDVISTLTDLGSLATRAYRLSSYSNGTVAKALGKPREAAGMPGLMAALGSLGRLARVFGALARATNLPGFDNLSIVPVTVSTNGCSPGPQQGEPWSLEAALAALDLQPHPMSVAQVMGKAGATAGRGKGRKKSRSNKPKGGKPHPLSFAEMQNGFDNLQELSSEPHAEVQLVLAAATRDQDDGGGSMFPYMGCSKKSCLLCAKFLQEYQGLTTRGCHRKLYGTWTVPSLSLDADAVKVAKAVEAVEGAMKSALLSTATVASPARGKASGSARCLLSAATTTANPPRDRGDDGAWAEWIAQGRLRAERVPASAAVASPVGDAPEIADTQEGDLTSLLSSLGCTEAPATGDAEAGECLVCDMDTARRCSGCGRRYFCSERCQEKTGYLHLEECSYRGSITTADRLSTAMAADLRPTDVQTREDFGFSRCRHPKEECSLLGLYQGIHYLPPEYDDDEEDIVSHLHQWQQSGTLAENIIKAFSRLPEERRGGYFPWFLRNRHVLDFSIPAPDEETRERRMIEAALERGRTRYLPATERDQDPRGYRPWAKRYCFLFYALALDSLSPEPGTEGVDHWYGFGFATCDDEQDEGRLGTFYARLFGSSDWEDEEDPRLPISARGSVNGPGAASAQKRPACPFDEFWRAWVCGRLPDLFAKYLPPGGDTRVNPVNNRGSLMSFLSLRPSRSVVALSGRSSGVRRELELRFAHPSIWRLKHLLALTETQARSVLLGQTFTDMPELRRVAEEYGFSAAMIGTKQLSSLADFYRRLLKKEVLDPMEVHRVRTAGRLLELVEGHEKGREVLAGAGQEVRDVLRRLK